MSWRKKYDSRAYEPADLTTLTPTAGAVANVNIQRADFTIASDYFCLFNVNIEFDQTTATTTRLEFKLPLPLNTAGRLCYGSGYIVDAAAGSTRPVHIVRDGTTVADCRCELSVALSIGAGHRLVVQGHYPIR